MYNGLTTEKAYLFFFSLYFLLVLGSLCEFFTFLIFVMKICLSLTCGFGASGEQGMIDEAQKALEEAEALKKV